MKKIIFISLVIIFNPCTNNVNVENLKYSAKDLKPLSDSTEALYHDDAAFVEFGQIIKDSVKKYEQVELNEDTIKSYYNDLLYIYNNSYKISNSFFEYATSLHSLGDQTLYHISVSVDTNKNWANNWVEGIKNTGIIKIDSIINDYNLEVNFVFKSDSIYWFQIKSSKPINYISLMEKFKNTNEFINIEPTVFIGTGSNISLSKENQIRYYKYYYGWGDCPSGCINHHYWIVALKDNQVELTDEGGEPLSQK